MTQQHYPLKDVKAEYFTAPTSGTSNGFRTMPNLLRAVADWMDANDLQDPEFDGLKIGLTFPESSGGDEFYQHVTVYYRTDK